MNYLLDKLPKRLHSGAKKKIHEMYQAATKQQALEAFDGFMALYEEENPRACASR